MSSMSLFNNQNQMRQYLKYVFAAIASLAFLSCSVETLDPDFNQNEGQIAVVGRISRFSDHDVATRGIKNSDEGKITSMAIAVFPVNSSGTGLSGGCQYYNYLEMTDNQGDMIFFLDRGIYTRRSRYAIYVFANMPGLNGFSTGATLEQILSLSTDVSNVDIPTNGFPMIGSIGDTFSTDIDPDGRVLILCPTTGSGNREQLVDPTVDGVSTTMLPIAMQALYAKVNFTVQVEPDQTVQGGLPPLFTMESYTINNIPSSVDFKNTTNSDAAVIAESFKRVPSGNTNASVSSGQIKFSFYVPERLLTPSAQYTYPFDKNNPNNANLLQRHKPKLVGSAQKATNVVLSGKFRNHQGHYLNVDYTIYLGEDAAVDFNIKRNVEYNNIITLRGIQASAPDENNPQTNYLYIDHRVEVEHSQPAIITLHREVLLDSHYEIRPLRVARNTGILVPGITNVKVEILDPSVTNWMRIERSAGVGSSYAGKTNGNGESIYITATGASKGKRRYFTHNLITGANADSNDYPLNNSTEVILPISGDCAWIYVDECTEYGDDVRSGKIRVTYGALRNGVFVPTADEKYPPIEYTISQRKLFRVNNGNRQYDIEYYEEYLHNFDAADDYEHVDYDGMPWGLDGIQLSYDHPALYFESYLNWDLINGVLDNLVENADIQAHYDFYIRKHDAEVADREELELHEYAGYDFSSEIIQVVNGYGENGHDTDPSNDIDILPLNEEPRSAVEYCYNKNKRDSEGHVVTGTNTSRLNWYLPAIDEVEDIVTSTYNGGQSSTYGRFTDFQEKFYWSSQPAYIRNYASTSVWVIITIPYYGEYYFDDVNYARSSRVTLNDNNQYSYVPSGTVGYYGALEVESNGTYDLQTEGNYRLGTGQTVLLGTVTHEDGNRARNSKARVRCVRRR